MSNGQGRPIFPVSIGVQQVRLRDYFAEERKRLEDEIEGVQLPVSSQSDTCKPLTFASDAPAVADILLVALGSRKPASEGFKAPCNPGYALLGAAPDTKLDAVRLPGSSKAAAAALGQLFHLPSAHQVPPVWAPQSGETSALRQCMIDLVKGAPSGLPSFWLSDAKDTCLAAKHSGMFDPQGHLTQTQSGKKGLVTCSSGPTVHQILSKATATLIAVPEIGPSPQNVQEMLGQVMGLPTASSTHASAHLDFPADSISIDTAAAPTLPALAAAIQQGSELAPGPLISPAVPELPTTIPSGGDRLPLSAITWPASSRQQTADHLLQVLTQEVLRFSNDSMMHKEGTGPWGGPPALHLSSTPGNAAAGTTGQLQELQLDPLLAQYVESSKSLAAILSIAPATDPKSSPAHGLEGTMAGILAALHADHASAQARCKPVLTRLQLSVRPLLCPPVTLRQPSNSHWPSGHPTAATVKDPLAVRLFTAVQQHLTGVGLQEIAATVCPSSDPATAAAQLLQRLRSSRNSKDTVPGTVGAGAGSTTQTHTTASACASGVRARAWQPCGPTIDDLITLDMTSGSDDGVPMLPTSADSVPHSRTTSGAYKGRGSVAQALDIITAMGGAWTSNLSHQELHLDWSLMHNKGSRVHPNNLVSLVAEGLAPSSCTQGSRGAAMPTGSAIRSAIAPLASPEQQGGAAAVGYQMQMGELAAWRRRVCTAPFAKASTKEPQGRATLQNPGKPNAGDTRAAATQPPAQKAGMPLQPGHITEPQAAHTGRGVQPPEVQIHPAAATSAGKQAAPAHHAVTSEHQVEPQVEPLANVTSSMDHPAPALEPPPPAKRARRVRAGAGSTAAAEANAASSLAFMLTLHGKPLPVPKPVPAQPAAAVTTGQVEGRGAAGASTGSEGQQVLQQLDPSPASEPNGGLAEGSVELQPDTGCTGNASAAVYPSHSNQPAGPNPVAAAALKPQVVEARLPPSLAALLEKVFTARARLIGRLRMVPEDVQIDQALLNTGPLDITSTEAVVARLTKAMNHTVAGQQQQEGAGQQSGGGAGDAAATLRKQQQALLQICMGVLALTKTGQLLLEHGVTISHLYLRHMQDTLPSISQLCKPVWAALDAASKRLQQQQPPSSASQADAGAGDSGELGPLTDHPKHAELEQVLSDIGSSTAAAAAAAGVKLLSKILILGDSAAWFPVYKAVVAAGLQPHQLHRGSSSHMAAEGHLPIGANSGASAVAAQPEHHGAADTYTQSVLQAASRCDCLLASYPQALQAGFPWDAFGAIIQYCSQTGSSSHQDGQLEVVDTAVQDHIHSSCGGHTPRWVVLHTPVPGSSAPPAPDSQPRGGSKVVAAAVAGSGSGPQDQQGAHANAAVPQARSLGQRLASEAECHDATARGLAGQAVAEPPAAHSNAVPHAATRDGERVPAKPAPQLPDILTSTQRPLIISNSSGSLLVQRRDLYEALLALEHPPGSGAIRSVQRPATGQGQSTGAGQAGSGGLGVELVERPLMFADLVLTARTCLCLWPIQQPPPAASGPQGGRAQQHVTCEAVCSEVLNRLSVLGKAYSHVWVILEAEGVLALRVQQQALPLQAAAEALGVSLQLLTSCTPAATKALMMQVTRCVAGAFWGADSDKPKSKKIATGPPPTAQMSDILTPGEQFLSTFTCLNPLSAAVLRALGVTARELMQGAAAGGLVQLGDAVASQWRTLAAGGGRQSTADDVTKDVAPGWIGRHVPAQSLALLGEAVRAANAPPVQAAAEQEVQEEPLALHSNHHQQVDLHNDDMCTDSVAVTPPGARIGWAQHCGAYDQLPHNAGQHLQPGMRQDEAGHASWVDCNGQEAGPHMMDADTVSCASAPAQHRGHPPLHPAVQGHQEYVAAHGHHGMEGVRWGQAQSAAAMAQDTYPQTGRLASAANQHPGYLAEGGIGLLPGYFVQPGQQHGVEADEEDEALDFTLPPLQLQQANDQLSPSQSFAGNRVPATQGAAARPDRSGRPPPGGHSLGVSRLAKPQQQTQQHGLLTPLGQHARLPGRGHRAGGLQGAGLSLGTAPSGRQANNIGTGAAAALNGVEDDLDIELDMLNPLEAPQGAGAAGAGTTHRSARQPLPEQKGGRGHAGAQAGLDDHLFTLSDTQQELGGYDRNLEGLQGPWDSVLPRGKLGRQIPAALAAPAHSVHAGAGARAQQQQQGWLGRAQPTSSSHHSSLGPWGEGLAGSTGLLARGGGTSAAAPAFGGGGTGRWAGGLQAAVLQQQLQQQREQQLLQQGQQQLLQEEEDDDYDGDPEVAGMLLPSLHDPHEHHPSGLPAGTRSAGAAGGTGSAQHLFQRFAFGGGATPVQQAQQQQLQQQLGGRSTALTGAQVGGLMIAGGATLQRALGSAAVGRGMQQGGLAFGANRGTAAGQARWAAEGGAAGGPARGLGRGQALVAGAARATGRGKGGGGGGGAGWGRAPGKRKWWPGKKY